MQHELEVKFLGIDKDDLRSRLEQNRAELVHEERLMRRRTYDFPGITLEPGEYKWLRIRDEGDKVTMTLKHLFDEQRIDNTTELEMEISNFDTAMAMFKEMELIERPLQETYRERWELDGVEVTIDSWPALNPFVEIEGKNEDIVKEVSEQLGFDYEEGLFGTVDYVYEKELNIPLSKINSVSRLAFDNVDEILKLTA